MNVLEWLPQGPDLALIENVWAIYRNLKVYLRNPGTLSL